MSADKKLDRETLARRIQERGADPDALSTVDRLLAEVAAERRLTLLYRWLDGEDVHE